MFVCLFFICKQNRVGTPVTHRLHGVRFAPPTVGALFTEYITGFVPVYASSLFLPVPRLPHSLPVLDRRAWQWERNGGPPGTLYEMALHPGAARKYAVSTLWNRSRQRARLPTAGCQLNPRNWPETQRVSFLKR